MASSWTITSPKLGIPDIEAITDSIAGLNVRLGEEVDAWHHILGYGRFKLLFGVASLALDDAVTYNGYTGAVTRWAGTAGTGMPLAFAKALNVDPTKYSWYQICGNAIANTNSTIAAGDDLFWQATATLSTTQVNGKQVLNAVAVTANNATVDGVAIGSGKSVISIQYPFAQGQVV